MKTTLKISVGLVLFLALAMPTWAHVVVRPNQAGVASRTVFTVSVPNEKAVPTTQVKLLLPSGLNDVTPNVKPGWTVKIEKDAQGKPTALVWSGSLPAEFRDEFSFQAQVPATAGVLAWKAYQTYQGGVLVSWDVDPTDPAAKDAEALEKTGKGPYSVTKVIDDLTAPAAAPVAPAPAAQDSTTSLVALVVSVVALVVGLVALLRRRKV